MENISVEKELLPYNLDGKWNDYIGVQKEVVSILRSEEFFQPDSITNVETGISVRITPKGIKETLGNGNRFQTLPKKLKMYKVATIRRLPKLIETGYIIDSDVENTHDKNGYRYAYIGNKITIDGNEVRIRIAIKKKVGSNHFWIHNIDEYKKDSELLSPSQ